MPVGCRDKKTTAAQPSRLKPPSPSSCNPRHHPKHDQHMSAFSPPASPALEAPRGLAECHRRSVSGSDCTSRSSSSCLISCTSMFIPFVSPGPIIPCVGSWSAFAHTHDVIHTPIRTALSHVHLKSLETLDSETLNHEAQKVLKPQALDHKF